MLFPPGGLLGDMRAPKPHVFKIWLQGILLGGGGLVGGLQAIGCMTLKGIVGTQDTPHYLTMK